MLRPYVGVLGDLVVDAVHLEYRDDEPAGARREQVGRPMNRAFRPCGDRRGRSILDPMEQGQGRLEVLSEAECRWLLAATDVGRVVYTDGALPAIAVVNYLVHGDTIVIRSLPGAKLSAAHRRDVVAFEVDAIDPRDGSGWSVVVIGEARLVRDRVEADLLAALPLRSRVADPEPAAFLRIQLSLISGRRVVVDPTEAREVLAEEQT